MTRLEKLKARAEREAQAEKRIAELEAENARLRAATEQMTPKERAREAAKKLVRAYEVGATMKDLDGVVATWTNIVEQAITAAIAELEAENAKLTRAVLYLRGDCVKPDAVREYRKDLPQNYHNKQDYIDDETGVNLSLPPDATE